MALRLLLILEWFLLLLSFCTAEVLLEHQGDEMDGAITWRGSFREEEQQPIEVHVRILNYYEPELDLYVVDEDSPPGHQRRFMDEFLDRKYEMLAVVGETYELVNRENGVMLTNFTILQGHDYKANPLRLGPSGAIPFVDEEIWDDEEFNDMGNSIYLLHNQFGDVGYDMEDPAVVEDFYDDYYGNHEQDEENEEDNNNDNHRFEEMEDDEDDPDWDDDDDDEFLEEDNDDDSDNDNDNSKRNLFGWRAQDDFDEVERAMYGV